MKGIKLSVIKILAFSVFLFAIAIGLSDVYGNQSYVSNEALNSTSNSYTSKPLAADNELKMFACGASGTKSAGKACGSSCTSECPYKKSQASGSECPYLKSLKNQESEESETEESSEDEEIT